MFLLVIAILVARTDTILLVNGAGGFLDIVLGCHGNTRVRTTLYYYGLTRFSRHWLERESLLFLLVFFLPFVIFPPPHGVGFYDTTGVNGKRKVTAFRFDFDDFLFYFCLVWLET
jgi:hypothetical protein